MHAYATPNAIALSSDLNAGVWFGNGLKKRSSPFAFLSRHRLTVRVGNKSYNTFGCKGASNHVDFSYYPTLTEARRGLMEEKGVTKILGVEIVEGAVPIEDHPFDGNTAFIMGNEVRARSTWVRRKKGRWMLLT